MAKPVHVAFRVDRGPGAGRGGRRGAAEL